MIVCKGFASREALRPVLEALDGLLCELVEVSDEGFDLSAYANAASRLDSEWLVFLNSSSEILADGWLEIFRAALSPDVGIVGATGSWASSNSLARYHLRLPSVYNEIFPDHDWFHAQTGEVERLVSEAAAAASPPPGRVRIAMQMLHSLAAFPAFPSSHVRTTAFAIRTPAMRALAMPRLRTKELAWSMESGRRSFTRQIVAKGLRAAVVGRDGVAYEPDAWHLSDTFWQAGQANLLVADRQTEKYRLAGIEGRRLLAGMAWGELARPADPTPPAAADA